MYLFDLVFEDGIRVPFNAHPTVTDEEMEILKKATKSVPKQTLNHLRDWLDFELPILYNIFSFKKIWKFYFVFTK